MFNPEIDPWPSVDDDDEAHADDCVYCEAMPDEPHHPRCPLRGPTVLADEILFCDQCGQSYVTNCICGYEES